VETARFGPLQGRSMQAAVMLSEALRRNAKHEARLFKYLMVIGAPREMIRDGKPGLADFVRYVAASLRSE
jgi:hypothetical protein